MGIFEEKEECLVDPESSLNEQQMACLLQTLQSGKNLVASGYCMYSSSTIMVLTLGDGSVHGFTLDSQIGEFVLTHPNIRTPSRGKIYSVNEANFYDWDPNLQTYISNLKAGKGDSGENRIMEVEPKSVHQRIPCFLGSPEDVEEVKNVLAKSDKSEPAEKESEKATA